MFFHSVEIVIIRENFLLIKKQAAIENCSIKQVLSKRFLKVSVLHLQKKSVLNYVSRVPYVPVSRRTCMPRLRTCFDFFTCLTYLSLLRTSCTFIF